MVVQLRKEYPAPPKESAGESAGTYEYEMMVLNIILQTKGIMSTNETLEEVVKIRDACTRLLKKYAPAPQCPLKTAFSILTRGK